MTPYYEKHGVTLFLSDCRDVLPTLKNGRHSGVSLLVTDPPYGVEARTTGNRTTPLPSETMMHDTSTEVSWTGLRLAWEKLPCWRHAYVFGPFDLAELRHAGAVTQLVWDKGKFGSDGGPLLPMGRAVTLPENLLWAHSPPNERTNPDCDGCALFGICMYHDAYGRDAKGNRPPLPNATTTKTDGDEGRTMTNDATEKTMDWRPTRDTYAPLTEPVRVLLVRHGFDLFDDVRHLVRMEIPKVAQNAILALVRPADRIGDAIDVARFWGFSPKGEIALTHEPRPDAETVGLSVVTIATRGRIVSRDKGVRLNETSFVASSAIHAWFERISDGPLVELLAVTPTPGWWAFGPNVAGFTAKGAGSAPAEAATVPNGKIGKDFLRNIHGDPAIRAKLIKLAFADGIIREADLRDGTKTKDTWTVLVEAVPTLTSGVPMRWFEQAMQKLGLVASRDVDGKVVNIAHVPALEASAETKVSTTSIGAGPVTVVQLSVAETAQREEMVVVRETVGAPIEEPDPFSIDDPDAPPETLPAEEASAKPSFTDQGFSEGKRKAMVAAAERQGLIPPKLTFEEAWVKLQYAAPVGWFTQFSRNSSDCAACDRGERITVETAYLHVCEESKEVTQATQAPAAATSKPAGAPGRPQGAKGKCGKCGGTGHNARTCPGTEASPMHHAEGENGRSTNAWARCIASAESLPSDVDDGEEAEVLLRSFGGTP